MIDSESQYLKHVVGFQWRDQNGEWQGTIRKDLDKINIKKFEYEDIIIILDEKDLLYSDDQPST